MSRGDNHVVAPLSPFNKPRPAVIVQARVAEESENITVALITSDLFWSAPGIRVPVQPTHENGLRKASEVMVDNVQTLPRNRFGERVGAMEPEAMSRVDVALRMFLGLP